MDSDDRRRAFRDIAMALGSDPDLAQDRATQLAGQHADTGPADVYLLVLHELTDGMV